jgi:hypothetical protein
MPADYVQNLVRRVNMWSCSGSSFKEYRKYVGLLLPHDLHQDMPFEPFRMIGPQGFRSIRYKKLHFSSLEL